MKESILITGGGGFLGYNLANRFAELGHKVRALDVRKHHVLNKKVEYIQGDIRDIAVVERACRDVEVVYNLASLLPCSRAGRMFWHVNVGGTSNLLSAAMQNKVKRFVHVSSSIVYGIPKGICTEETPPRPVGDYGRSKLRAEEVCQEYFKKGLDGVILRPRFIVGPGRLGLLTILFDWINKGKNVYVIGNGKNRFQMINVFDMLDACVCALKKGHNGEIFNIGSDKVPPVGELLNDLIQHAQSSSKVRPINATVARTMLQMLDFFKLTPLNAEHYLIADKDYVLNTEKAKKVLGWKPKYSQEKSMRQAYDWYMRKAVDSSEIHSDFPNEGILKLIKAFS